MDPSNPTSAWRCWLAWSPEKLWFILRKIHTLTFLDWLFYIPFFNNAIFYFILMVTSLQLTMIFFLFRPELDQTFLFIVYSLFYLMNAWLWSIICFIILCAIYSLNSILHTLQYFRIFSRSFASSYKGLKALSRLT